MAISREKKQQIIEELKEKIGRQKAGVFVDFTGLKVKDLSILRRQLKQNSSELKVAKKTLFGLAFKEKGIKIDLKKMKGEIALVSGFNDEISPFKLSHQFSLQNPNLKILGGVLGNELKTAEEAVTLAQLPSRLELLAKTIATLNAPISGLVNVLKGNLKGLAVVLSAIKTKIES